jgi:hypothetical protein
LGHAIALIFDDEALRKSTLWVGCYASTNLILYECQLEDAKERNKLEEGQVVASMKDSEWNPLWNVLLTYSLGLVVEKSSLFM